MTNQISDNNKRIAKNTLLYFRMLFMMVVSLYTSRVILNALGVEDFGIYNVVGGVVAMFTVISGSLSAAISRFITYELGKGDQYKLQKLYLVVTYEDKENQEWHILMPSELTKALSTSLNFYLDMANKGVKAPSAKQLRMMSALGQLFEDK